MYLTTVIRGENSACTTRSYGSSYLRNLTLAIENSRNGYRERKVPKTATGRSTRPVAITRGPRRDTWKIPGEPACQVLNFKPEFKKKKKIVSNYIRAILHSGLGSDRSRARMLRREQPPEPLEPTPRTRQSSADRRRRCCRRVHGEP